VNQKQNPLVADVFDGCALYWLLWWRSFFLALFVATVLDWNTDTPLFDVAVAYLIIFPLVSYSALRKNYWRKNLIFVDPETGKSIGTPKTDHPKLLKVLFTMLASTYLLALGIVPVATVAVFWMEDPALSWDQIRTEIVGNILLTMAMLAPIVASATAFLWKHDGFRLEAVRKEV